MNPQFRLFLTFVGLTVVFIYLFFEMTSESVDTVYINGRIYTVDSENAVVEAIAVRGDRIAGVGTTETIMQKFKAKTVIDLKGKTVIPGLIDAHAHLLSLGIAKLTLDVIGTASQNEIAGLVRERATKAEAGQWIRGRGWDQNDWAAKKFPSHETLDRAAPVNPVYLVRVDGHAVWVNKKAMEIAGITRETSDPSGGKIIRDAQGNPTGVFIDAAIELVRKSLPSLSAQESEEALRLAIQECLKYGITCVHDMGVDLDEVDLYKKFIDHNEFPFRVYAAIGGVGETWEYFKKNGPLIGYGKNQLTVRAIKMYIDGALGSRGAALLEPYSDDPDNRGLTVTSEEDLRTIVDEAVALGFQVCTHAIGDRGNNIVLNVYDAALQAHPVSNHRLRVEHAQVLFSKDIPRFKNLGIIPSMQPTHCTSDMYWAEARLGPTRVRGAYAWHSILETGMLIAGGSDFPVEHPNPLLGFYAAITRQDQQGHPKNADDVRQFFQMSDQGITDATAFDGGWYALEKMSREEALKAFTIWAAYAGFQEQYQGSLEVGKLADFVVLSSDILKTDPAKIPSTAVERTFVGGKEVYSHLQETTVAHTVK